MDLTSMRRCILPPHMLEALARNGSHGQRANALDTLSIDHTLRSLRFVRAAAPKVARLASPHAYAAPSPKRTIFSAGNEEQLPGRVVRVEGAAATGDPAVDEAYDGLGSTFGFYFEVFQRNSIDNQGLPLHATVHYGESYDNAYWDGDQMVFGDGDAQVFNRFTIALEVIAHELTHGVTDVEASLQYANQSGALNESISDVFGSLVKQYVLKQTVEQADWLIGKGLLAANIQGDALRSMKEPGTAYDDPLLGKDPQPGHMRDYVRTVRDNGGVHINSGIPNRAFYLTASALGGHAWEAPGIIWYTALRDPSLRPNTSFRSFARLTATVAARLFTSNGREHKAVLDAWDEVGVSTR